MIQFKSIDLNTKKPIYIIFEITKRCNFDCDYCTYERRPLELSYDVVKNVIDKLSLSNEVCDIDFMGGEVTLHKDLVDIVKYSLNKLGKSIIHISTNLSKPISYWTDFYNKLKNEDIDRMIFYTTYHSTSNIIEFKEKIDYLISNNFRIFIKLLCDSNKLDHIKYCYNLLKQCGYEKFFVKYLWKYRDNSDYSNEYLQWMEESSIDNNDIFTIIWQNGENEFKKEYSYKELKKENLDIFKDLYCRVNRHLSINVLGNIEPTCLRNKDNLISKHHSLGNVFFIKNFDKIFEEKNKLVKCQNSECTELFLNPYKQG